MKPEKHVDYITERCYLSNIEDAEEKNSYIGCTISQEDIGNLLQGQAITLLFLNDDYEETGMIDIKLGKETKFTVPDRINNYINEEK